LRVPWGPEAFVPRMTEHPIYMWGCKQLHWDNVTNLVTVQCSQRSVTNLTKVSKQMPTYKSISVVTRLLWHTRVGAPVWLVAASGKSFATVD
jgi:hypothetical protein